MKIIIEVVSGTVVTVYSDDANTEVSVIDHDTPENDHEELCNQAGQMFEVY